MQDLIYMGTIIAFFTLGIVYVQGCNRIQEPP